MCPSPQPPYRLSKKTLYKGAFFCLLCIIKVIREPDAHCNTRAESCNGRAVTKRLTDLSPDFYSSDLTKISAPTGSPSKQYLFFAVKNVT